MCTWRCEYILHCVKCFYAHCYYKFMIYQFIHNDPTYRTFFVCFVLFFVVIIILFWFFVLEKWRSSSAPYHTPVFMYHPVSLLALRRKMIIYLSPSQCLRGKMMVYQSSPSQSLGSETQDDNLSIIAQSVSWL